jgi:hypothetical protein
MLPVYPLAKNLGLEEIFVQARPTQPGYGEVFTKGHKMVSYQGLERLVRLLAADFDNIDEGR